MNCDRAEKISLLIDGELPADERRATESHLESCAACRRTREDFLSLRSVVNSYPLATDAAAERRALAKILASAAQPAHGVAAATTAAPPRTSWRELLRLPRLTPALGSALAVLLLAVALGVVWAVGRRDTRPQLAADETRQDSAPEGTHSAPQTARRETTPDATTPDASTSDASKPATLTPDASTADASKPAVPASVNPAERATAEVTAGGAHKSGRRVFDAARAVERRAAAVAARRGPRPPAAGVGETVETASVASSAGEAARRESAAAALAEFRPLFIAAGAPAGDELARPAGERAGAAPQGDTARHLEQAQRLMRTIRNARPGDRPAAIADERRRSQKLLYRNIVLRREAARAGNAPVERALDSLEPLLIDIANLPERASREDVSLIQERVRRKNIVAVLQANIAAAPRTFQ